MRSLILAFSLIGTLAQAVPAPDFSLAENPLGSRLSDLKGKVVYLDFWASWCKPCRHSFPFMNDLQARYGDEGLVVLAINLDAEPELAKAFLSENPARFAVQYDPNGQVAQQYQLIGMPSSYLIDANGEIRFAHKGFFTDKARAYEQEIQTLLSEVNAEVPTNVGN
ncbi:TlpA disulfide reductase family protein [Aliiglaciecola sp. CAU 1673]|uniref:peroxiredoxin family protein n=1 Tax=Aliiglaciecola sp. CAU 1673 TaxID=3032595 RepID=UPI0023DC6DDD|nr:TlpA disulfide reductase family protein [Aliiglaciecola sp. CAU 1673]MDF2177276.1 TlpA disulfide reductase family protein [Aliiglaciecola sp. CAU 1673]